MTDGFFQSGRESRRQISHTYWKTGTLNFNLLLTCPTALSVLNFNLTVSLRRRPGHRFFFGRIFRCQIFALMLAKSVFFFLMLAAKWSQIFLLSQKMASEYSISYFWSQKNKITRSYHLKKGHPAA